MTQTARILSIVIDNFVGTGNATLNEIYAAVRPMMHRLYPNNTTVDDTIRNRLNALVNDGLLVRVSNGVYSVD